MHETPCPFCGVLIDLPHETQEACIAALHVEIARVRAIVDRGRLNASPPHEPDRPEEPPPRG
jgi:hypothetical protein